MIYLPKCLAPACKLAKDDNARYALNSVRLQELDAGEDGAWYRLEVTDGKVAVVIRGPSESVSMDQAAAEVMPALEAPEVEALVVAGELHKALASAPKGGHLGLRLGKERVLASTWSGTQILPVGQGKFPSIDAVLPAKGPVAQARLGPRLLIELLRAALAVCEEGNEQVCLLFYGKDQPLGLMTRGANGLTFDGLIMPLTS